MFHALDETDVEFPRLGFEDAALHRDAGLHQTQQAATGDLGVGILHRRDHPRHPGAHQRIGARRGAAEVAAGLEGHVGGGAACILAGLAQGMDLGVRLAGADVPALADHLAVLDQHAADARIRMGGVQPWRASSRARAMYSGSAAFIPWPARGRGVRSPRGIR